MWTRFTVQLLKTVPITNTSLLESYLSDLSVSSLSSSSSVLIPHSFSPIWCLLCDICGVM